MNDATIRNAIGNELTTLRETYGQPFVSETERARWVLWTVHRTDPYGPCDTEMLKTLRAYNVQRDVIIHVGGQEPPAPETKARRSDKYQAIISWVEQNHRVQVTANEVAEAGSISYPTALKFIKDRPDLFYRIKKGLYEVRDPKIVRQEEALQN